MLQLSPLQSGVPDDTGRSLDCLNCGYQGAGKFCQECGQTYAVKRITTTDLLHEVFHFFTHLEAAHWYTLRQLLRKPGTMQREFLAGSRKRYQKPVSAFLVSASISALGMFGIRELAHQLYGVVDPEGEVMRHYLGLSQLFLLPVYALLTWQVLRETRLNYAENGVVILYNLALLMLLLLPINAIRLVAPRFETAFLELPMIWTYNTITYLNLVPAPPPWRQPGARRWVMLAKSILLNLTCYGLARLLMYALMAVKHH